MTASTRLALLAAILLIGPAMAQEQGGDEVLLSVSEPGGIAVFLGVEYTSLAGRLAVKGPWIVHVLEADEAKALAARGRVKSAGQVLVDPWKASTLPYPENLVNLLVAADSRAVPEAELLRVLAPRGAAWIRKNGGWERLLKPPAAGHDEWTHWRHGADGNMVSHDRAVAAPSELRWVAGPAQDAGGKKWYYDHILVSANGRNFYVFDELLVARDAHNGALLWSRPFKASSYGDTGLPVPDDAPQNPKPRIGGRLCRVRPVAAGELLLVATEEKILALDGRTGETVATLGEAKAAREILVDGGVVLVADAKAVRAWDLATRRPLWEISVQARRLVTGDGAVFAVTLTHVVALDRASGKELWRAEEPEAPRVLSCSYQGGILVLEKSTLRDDALGSGIRVYDTKLGEVVWTRDYKPDMSHYREARAYFAQGLLWIQAEKDRLLGLDPKSGSERKEWKSRGKHCAAPVASERFFMAPECEFTDLATGAQSRSRMFKSACRLPFIPANGLLYTFPVQCECYPMLRGYMGLASGTAPEIAAGPRRVEGAARVEPPVALLKPEADWPTYRGDVHRSAGTSAKIGEGPLRKLWETTVAAPAEGPLAAEWASNPFVRGPLTPLTASGGRVFTAAPDLNRVFALDAATGKVLWSFAAGGRVDGPPTIHEGLALFGCHDGWIYAVRAEDGVLAWRLRAAPREARIPAYGQIESPWPVVASVLVDRGLAYAAAGRHPSCDGGVRILAFRPRTGELAWEQAVDDLDEITKWYGGTIVTKAKIGLDFEPVDLLVRDGDRVAMSRWVFDAATGKGGMALESVEYLAGGLKVPRGLWGYGIRQTKMVTPKPPAAFDTAGIRKGLAKDLALILVGGVTVAANAAGELRVGDRIQPLDAPPVPDGLIALPGRLFLATTKGTVVCLASAP